MIKTHHSAIKRHKFSRPISLAIDQGIIKPGLSVFDYGCGLGGDVWRLKQFGCDAKGFDPYYAPNNDLIYSDVVLCLFVLDVIPDPEHRFQCLKKAWFLTRDHLIIAVRMDAERRTGKPYGDGYRKNRTYHTGWRQPEFRQFVETTLQQRTKLLGLGVVVVSKLFDGDRHDFDPAINSQ